MNDNATLTGIIGTTTSFTGFMISLMPHIEAGLRLGGLFVSLVAGILTAVYMLKKIRNNER
jgi:hypothetical protein